MTLKGCFLCLALANVHNNGAMEITVFIETLQLVCLDDFLDRWVGALPVTKS